MGQWLTRMQEECVAVDSYQSNDKSTPTMTTTNVRDDTKRRLLQCDPRSPTVDINRTPIQVTATPIRRIADASSSTPISANHR